MKKSIVNFSLALISTVAGLANAQSLPLVGTYISEDQNFTLEITSTDSWTGTAKGTYKTSYSPVGPFTVQGDVGHYSWVANSPNGAGTAPFAIDFTGFQRPNGFPYVVNDKWNGIYLTNNTIRAEGTRAYINSAGVTEISTLGTLVFTRK